MNDQDRKARELKPCPFCGGAAFMFPDSEWVQCESCGATGAGFESAGKAAAAWNTRALGLAAPEGFVMVPREALESAIRRLDPQDGLVVGEYMRIDAAYTLRGYLSAAPKPAATEGKPCATCRGRGYVVDADIDDDGRSIGTMESCPSCAAKPAADGVTEAMAPVAFAEHMDLKLRATELCERLSALVQTLWVMSDVADFEHNGVSVSQIVADLHAAETASEMMAALTGESSPAALAAARKGEG